jgi:hypothetical protein
MNKRDNIIKWSIISIFIGLYVLTSAVSTIHVIDFFRLSNPEWLAITLAIAFEVGAAASLAAIIILDKTSKNMVWGLFILITGMQMMGNMYYSYTHLSDYSGWSELFGILEEEPVFQKRVLSIVSGAILPLVALGFIKSLVDYIRPSKVEEIKAEFETKRAFDEELERELKIQSSQPVNNMEEPEEPVHQEIDELEPEKISDLDDEVLNTENSEANILEAEQIDEEAVDREKSRKTEQKIVCHKYIW